MKVTIELQGMLKKIAGWKAKHIVEIEEGATFPDALRKVGIDIAETKAFGFAIIQGKKIKEDYQLKDGDVVKAFPKSFGG